MTEYEKRALQIIDRLRDENKITIREKGCLRRAILENRVPDNVEIWNGYHGHCIAPKGTFEAIWNDEENEDIF